MRRVRVGGFADISVRRHCCSNSSSIAREQARASDVSLFLQVKYRTEVSRRQRRRRRGQNF